MNKEQLILLKEKIKKESEELYFSYSDLGVEQSYNLNKIIKEDSNKAVSIITSNFESLINYYTKNNFDIDKIDLPIKFSLFIKKFAINFGTDEIIDEEPIIEDIVRLEICPATITLDGNEVKMSKFTPKDYEVFDQIEYIDSNRNRNKASFIVSFAEFKDNLAKEGFALNEIKSFAHLKQNAIIGEVTTEELSINFVAEQIKNNRR